MSGGARAHNSSKYDAHSFVKAVMKLNEAHQKEFAHPHMPQQAFN
jgi:hypothetical protein